MKITEILAEAKAIKQRLDPKCWTGKHKEGTKIKGGVRVNNCVPNESVGDVVDVYQHRSGVDLGKYGTFNIERETPTIIVVYDHNTKESLKFNRATGRGIGPASQLMIKHDVEEVMFLESQFDMIEEMIADFAEFHGVDEDAIWEDIESVMDEELLAEAEAWQTSKGKNKNGGLNKKGVASYRASHPGSKLQTAVTTKPSKLKKGSKASKRRKSFCARMKGMKKSRTSAKTARDPDSRINKSLRKWHCESVELNNILRLAGVVKVDTDA